MGNPGLPPERVRALLDHLAGGLNPNRAVQAAGVATVSEEVGFASPYRAWYHGTAREVAAGSVAAREIPTFCKPLTEYRAVTGCGNGKSQ